MLTWVLLSPFTVALLDGSSDFCSSALVTLSLALSSFAFTSLFSLLFWEFCPFALFSLLALFSFLSEVSFTVWVLELLLVAFLSLVLLFSTAVLLSFFSVDLLSAVLPSDLNTFLLLSDLLSSLFVLLATFALSLEFLFLSWLTPVLLFWASFSASINSSWLESAICCCFKYSGNYRWDHQWQSRKQHIIRHCHCYRNSSLHA